MVLLVIYAVWTVWSQSSLSASYSCSTKASTWPCRVIQSSSRISLYQRRGTVFSFVVCTVEWRL